MPGLQKPSTQAAHWAVNDCFPSIISRFHLISLGTRWRIAVPRIAKKYKIAARIFRKNVWRFHNIDSIGRPIPVPCGLRASPYNFVAAVCRMCHSDPTVRANTGYDDAYDKQDKRFRPAMVGNYNYAFGSPVRISQKRLRNYFAIVTCDHRRRREHGHAHGGRVAAGGGDNVVLNSVADRLFILSRRS